jgi:hypothetical protein
MTHDLGTSTSHRSDIMAILGNLLGFGMSRRRKYGMWNRGYGRGRSSWGRGYGHARNAGFLGSSLGRMTMGGLAFWLARHYMNRRAIPH